MVNIPAVQARTTNTPTLVSCPQCKPPYSMQWGGRGWPGLSFVPELSATSAGPLSKRERLLLCTLWAHGAKCSDHDSGWPPSPLGGFHSGFGTDGEFRRKFEAGSSEGKVVWALRSSCNRELAVSKLFRSSIKLAGRSRAFEQERYG